MITYQDEIKLHMNSYFSNNAVMCDPSGTILGKSNRKAMNRNWRNQKANPALKTKAGNK